MHFAYSDLRKIVVQLINGGAVKELRKNGSFIRYLTWMHDSKYLITYELGGANQTWYKYDLHTNSSSALWPERRSFSIANTNNQKVVIDRSELRELVWSQDEETVARYVRRNNETLVVVFDLDGANAKLLTQGPKIESIQWNPARTGWAGVVTENQKKYLYLNLGFEKNQLVEANSYGRIVFSRDGDTVYYTQGNDKGMLDLWKHNLGDNTLEQLTFFTRDSYEPSISNEGKAMFKLQDYKIFIAVVSGEGGLIQTLTGFQSEIPYWHPSGKKVFFTYGSWRRVMDDSKYPDIAQNLGVVSVDRVNPADEPEEIIRASYSEDQGMSWSPNLKWITFHTHADDTDDIWIQSVGDSSKGRPLSKGGYETGWPRWSPDGKWIVCNTAYTSERINKLFLIGMDQEKGRITVPQKEMNNPSAELTGYRAYRYYSSSNWPK